LGIQIQKTLRAVVDIFSAGGLLVMIVILSITDNLTILWAVLFL